MALSMAFLWAPLLSSSEAESEETVTVFCHKLSQSTLQVSMGQSRQVKWNLHTCGEIEEKSQERRQAGVSTEVCRLA